jgi:hypothetical protein
MIASEFIRVKRTREEIQAFLQDPKLPERIMRLLESRFSITLGVTGIIAGQSVATAIDELLGLTSNLQYADVDIFLPAPEQSQTGYQTRGHILVGDLPLFDKTFALRYFHKWVDRKFSHLDERRIEMAKKDVNLLVEFIKDVDSVEYIGAHRLFRALTSNNNSELKPTNMRGMMVLEDIQAENHPGYPTEFAVSNDFVETSTYSILGIKNQGVEQKIYYRSQHGTKPFKQALKPHQGFEGQSIICGFDLNCVSVGIDVLKGTLVYTPDYLDFMVNRQIQILQSKTPIQSVIRALKKSQEHAGFFNTDHSLEVMRHMLMYLGGEPIGLDMPSTYEPGSLYKVYAEYQASKITSKKPKAPYSAYKTLLIQHFPDKQQQVHMVRHVYNLFHTKQEGGVCTTSSRLKQLSDKNREMLNKVVEFHTDASGFYVFPVVKDFENIQYDCMLDNISYREFSGEDAIQTLAPLNSHSIFTVWQSIDAGMRFKKFRPAYKQRILDLYSTVYNDLTPELRGQAQKLYTNSTHLLPTTYGLVHLLLGKSPGTARAVLYRALKGQLSDNFIKLSEMSAKAKLNVMVARSHPIVVNQIMQHWLSYSKSVIQTTEDYTEYASFLRRFIDKYNAASEIYKKAAEILDISSHRLPEPTSVFPTVEHLWRGLPAQTNLGTSQAQAFFESGGTKSELLSFDNFPITDQNCFPFFNKLAHFEKAVKNNITGWPLLERFLEVWMGVGFTQLIREASRKGTDYLKQSFTDFESVFALEAINKWKNTCKDQGYHIANLEITELIRADSLVQEGIEMHHCVGGYTDRVRSCSSFIIKYRARVNTLEMPDDEFVGPPTPIVHEWKATAEWRNPTVKREDTDTPEKSTLNLYVYDCYQIRDVYNHTPHPAIAELNEALRTIGLSRGVVQLKTETNTELNDKVQAIVAYSNQRELLTYE